MRGLAVGMIGRGLGLPLVLALACGACVGVASAQPTEPLASYFGFDGQRIIVVDEGCGPAVSGDFNDDGRADIAVVNNAKSRIEIHYLRASERTEAERQQSARANEIPPSPWYDRQNVSVAHRVGSLLATDADGDGRLDLIYGGIDPAELVVLGQREVGEFSIVSRRRVRGLEAAPTTLDLGDVTGDEGRELLVTVGGAVNVVPLSARGAIGEPTPLGSPAGVRAVFVEDYDGDGRSDVLAVAPLDAAPVRVWLQSRGTTGSGELTRELRFEMPPLREAEPVRLPGEKACAFATIEEPTRRITLYRLTRESVPEGSDGTQGEVLAEVVGFADGRAADRAVDVVDLDGDGLPDLLATNKTGNSISVFRQRAGAGLTTGVASPSFREPTVVTAGQWTGDAKPEVFVASEAEATVGVCSYDPATGMTSFPQPIPLRTPGAAPVAMEHVTINGEPAVAVVVRKGRDLVVELHQADANGRYAKVDLPLAGITQAPRHILAHDADNDGQTDLLLLTPSQPMIMLYNEGGDGESGEFSVLKREDMRQFGLVSAAGPDNTVTLDVNEDGGSELLIASGNFVRACVYDAATGWRVVEQINVSDPGTQLTGLAAMDGRDGPRLMAADRAGQRILSFARDGGAWEVSGDLRLRGFPAGGLWAGVFTGDGQAGALTVSDDAFALVRLAGQRPSLETVAVYRSDSEDRLEHEIECGDVNGDGYLDMVVLDAREQMCQIYSVSAARRLLLATEFKVFESRLFSGGQALYEPSSALITDLTGDGRDDVLLTVHDRLIVYPQMAR